MSFPKLQNHFSKLAKALHQSKPIWWHVRQYHSTCICHFSFAFQSSASFFIRSDHMLALSSRGASLCTVIRYPSFCCYRSSKTHGFSTASIPESAIINRPSTFHCHPAFFFLVMIYLSHSRNSSRFLAVNKFFNSIPVLQILICPNCSEV